MKIRFSLYVNSMKIRFFCKQKGQKILKNVNVNLEHSEYTLKCESKETEAAFSILQKDTMEVSHLFGANDLAVEDYYSF